MSASGGQRAIDELEKDGHQGFTLGNFAKEQVVSLANPEGVFAFLDGVPGDTDFVQAFLQEACARILAAASFIAGGDCAPGVKVAIL